MDFLLKVAIALILSLPTLHGSVRLDRHDSNVPVNANNPGSIVADAANCSRDMSAMTTIVDRVRVVINRIDSEDVINIPIPIIIESVATLIASRGIQSCFTWITPHVRA